MEILVFQKNRQTKDGKKFKSHIGRMSKKDGTEITVNIRFPEGEAPGRFPCYIIVDKENANMSKRRYIAKNGTEAESYTLWIKKWEISDKPFVDNSLDDFE